MVKTNMILFERRIVPCFRRGGLNISETPVVKRDPNKKRKDPFTACDFGELVFTDV